MPRAKSSAELDAEIAAIKKKLAEKQKAARAMKQREERAARQAREYEENEFNRKFVERAKFIRFCDFSDDYRTVYELIESMLLHPAPYILMEDDDSEQEPDTLTPGLENEL